VVRTHASGVNPLDAKIRAGSAEHARHPLPAVLGIDLAGVVEALGPGVRGFAVGDAVLGMVGGVGGRPGTLAEQVAVDARLLAHKPSQLSMREAAALPLAAITAWEGLVDRAGVRAGQRVLIHGGAGGVGHLAVQIARARGATVFATGASHHRDLISRLGATFIDYRAEAVGDYVAKHADGGFDIVYDTVGGPVLDASFQAVRRFGHVVSCLGWGNHALAPLSFRAATYSGVFTLLPLLTGEGREHHGEILREVSLLAIAPVVDPRRFTFESIEDAHRAVIDGSAVVKIVVDL
jgi:NADPH:quinone reductase-like Zn-dependent oxidoreductase